MADNEYIKRSEVVCLIEEKIKRCDTVLETLAFASLRTKVMGLRSADVAPRAEVAREIFDEIENLLSANMSGEFRGDSIEWFDYFDLHLAEDIAELKNEYTEAEPPKGD